jgi:hypothetical protein
VFELEPVESSRLKVEGSDEPTPSTSKALDQLGTAELQLIAKYEMYERLEVKTLRNYTARFIAGLDEEEKSLIREYCAAKIAVLGGNATLTLKPINKTDAEA